MNLQELLNRWNIKCDINVILSMWNESHRHFTNLDHLNDLIDQINEKKSSFSQKEYEKLIITSLFHNCIYDGVDNRKKSADFFENCCIDKTNQDIKDIKEAILNTESLSNHSDFSKKFNQIDMNIVERDFDQLLQWEMGIREEYKFTGDNYKSYRIKFLESALDNYPHNTENLLKLIDFVKTA